VMRARASERATDEDARGSLARRCCLVPTRRSPAMSRSTSRTNSRSTSTGGNSNSSDLLSMELLSSPRASNDSSIGSATSSADNSNLFWLARQWRSGVQIYDRTYLFQTYRLCFVGSEAVDWLVANVPRLGGSRTEAVR